ncbi:MAG: hypothetical protein ABIK48_03420 [candidate division WOR-3 bacterium]
MKATKKNKKEIKKIKKPRASTGRRGTKKAEIKFIGKPMLVEKTDPAMVIQWPRTLIHHHTYGLLTPFFEGLKKGILRATRCPTPGCEKGLWLPPRADCPDCHARMEWVDLHNPVIGEIFTFTRVEYPGFGIELSYPYYQIDVKIPGCCTIMKGYLIRGEAKIGMKVKAGFRMRKPTNTILDLYWEPLE